MLSFRVFAARPPRRSPDSISNLAPISHPLSPNSFHCHRSEKTPVNSNHCHTSKIAVCNPCVCHTSEPPQGAYTRRSNIQTSRGPQPSNLPSIQRSNDLSPLFSYSCELFCMFLHMRKSQPLSFQALPHSLPKKRGGDTPNVPTFNLQTFKRSPRPIAANSFGATIPKGTRFLYDPG